MFNSEKPSFALTPEHFRLLIENTLDIINVLDIKGTLPAGSLREMEKETQDIIGPVSYTHLTLPTNREV